MTGRSYHNLHKYSDYHTSLISRRYVCKDYKQTGFSTVMETVANFCIMIGNLKQAAHQLMPAHGSLYQPWELMRMKDGSTPLKYRNMVCFGSLAKAAKKLSCSR